MPRADKDQVVGPDGTVLSEVEVTRPVPVIGDAELQQAKQNLRSYFQNFTTNGVPSGAPTDNQNRNAILSLIVVARAAMREMDDEV